MPIKTYIKISPPLKAVKVTEDNLEEVLTFCNATVAPDGIYLRYAPNNIDRSAYIPFGYWVVKFSDGYYKGYTPIVFAKYFHEVPDP